MSRRPLHAPNQSHRGAVGNAKSRGSCFNRPFTSTECPSSLVHSLGIHLIYIYSLVSMFSHLDTSTVSLGSKCSPTLPILKVHLRGLLYVFSLGFIDCHIVLDLLSKTLTFNPYKRVTVDQILAHPFTQNPKFTQALAADTVLLPALAHEWSFIHQELFSRVSWLTMHFALNYSICRPRIIGDSF